jgi:hypothetical protein
LYEVRVSDISATVAFSFTGIGNVVYLSVCKASAASAGDMTGFHRLLLSLFR